MDWWLTLTNDPPLEEIEDLTIAKFRKDLAVATYKRGPAGKDRILTQASVDKHMRHLRTMINKCGPVAKDGKPTKQLLYELPYFPPTKKKKYRPKPPVEMPEAKAIFTHCHTIVLPRRQEQYLSKAQWRAFFGLLFYTGFRLGTVLALRHKYLIRENGQHWLDVPEHAVSKTNKAFKKIVHPRLLALLGELPAKGDDLLIPWPVGTRRLQTMHEKIQIAAYGAKLHPFHAWRRAHACEMARLGSVMAMEIARASLDHCSSKITEEHYCQLEPELVIKLPDIVSPETNERQMLLF